LGYHGPLNENKVMGISGVFTNNTWSHGLGFYWSWSGGPERGRGYGANKSTGRRVAYDTGE